MVRIKKIVRDYKQLYEQEKSTNAYLLRQQKELKELAEKQGSEKAVFEHECIRLREQLRRLSK